GFSTDQSCLDCSAGSDALRIGFFGELVASGLLNDRGTRLTGGRPAAFPAWLSCPRRSEPSGCCRGSIPPGSQSAEEHPASSETRWFPDVSSEHCCEEPARWPCRLPTILFCSGHRAWRPYRPGTE